MSNVLFKKIFLFGFVVIGLSGCGTANGSLQSTQNNPVTTKNKTTAANTGSLHRAEPIKTALKQVDFHVKVPSYFPFKVTSSYAMVSPDAGHPKIFSLSLFYINKNANEYIAEEVMNAKTTYKIPGTRKKLSNGLTATVDHKGFSWHWSDNGTSYTLSAIKKSSSGKSVAPTFSAKEMEQVVTSMK